MPLWDNASPHPPSPAPVSERLALVGEEAPSLVGLLQRGGPALLPRGLEALDRQALVGLVLEQLEIRLGVLYV